MTTRDSGMPAMTHKVCRIDTEAALATVRDLGRRAETFDALMESARGYRHDDGRIHPDLDAAAWYAAVELHITPPPTGVPS